MGTETKIEWCDHTMNPWWGCVKVHTGCKNCYAERLDARTGGGHWGGKSPRRLIRSAWAEPDLWNAAAKKAGRVDRVFCASMCDLFEDYAGPVVDQIGARATDHTGRPWTLDLLRERLWPIVERTTSLLWLLLTKRPENVTRMVPGGWMKAWPGNVMVGTSVSDQETAEAYIPRLLAVPGRRFLSCEPLLGLLDLSAFCGGQYVGLPGDRVHDHYNFGIDWVIVGGESGAGARPCDVAWFRSIVSQCRAAGVPVFVKQLGRRPVIPASEPWTCLDRKGGDPDEWPEDLRVREFPR